MLVDPHDGVAAGASQPKSAGGLREEEQVQGAPRLRPEEGEPAPEVLRRRGQEEELPPRRRPSSRAHRGGEGEEEEEEERRGSLHGVRVAVDAFLACASIFTVSSHAYVAACT